MKVQVKSGLIQVGYEGIVGLEVAANLRKILPEAKINRLEKNISVPLGGAIDVKEIVGTRADYDLTFLKLHEKLVKHVQAINNFNQLIIEDTVSEILHDKWEGILENQQFQAVKLMTLNGLLGCCLFDEQGSGKTVMAIAAIEYLLEQKRIDSVLVVCPVSMINTWENELVKYIGTDVQISKLVGSSKLKRELLREEPDIIITNFEGLDSILVPLCSWLGNRKCLLIVDESFTVKNGESRRSIATLSCRKLCEIAYVLCGTPAPNSTADLIHQLTLSDLGYACRYIPDNESSSEAIKDCLESDGVVIRRLKTDILDFVPYKKFNIVSVQLSEGQRVLYEKIKSGLILELRSMTDKSFKQNISSYLAKRAKLLMLCSAPEQVDSLLIDQCAKYKILDELIEDLVALNQKIIIWSYYTNPIQQIAQRYLHLRPVVIDGSIDAAERARAVHAFQVKDEVKLFVGNPAAAGAGITLHSACNAIYFSLPLQAAHYLQSLDRIHRRGQTAEVVNYHFLVCERTIEVSALARLRQKELTQHDLFGEYVEYPSTLDEALSELLDA